MAVGFLIYYYFLMNVECLPGFAAVDIGDGMFAIGFKQVGCGKHDLVIQIIFTLINFSSI